MVKMEVSVDYNHRQSAIHQIKMPRHRSLLLRADIIAGRPAAFPPAHLHTHTHTHYMHMPTAGCSLVEPSQAFSEEAAWFRGQSKFMPVPPRSLHMLSLWHQNDGRATPSLLRLAPLAVIQSRQRGMYLLVPSINGNYTMKRSIKHSPGCAVISGRITLKLCGVRCSRTRFVA